MRPFPSLYGQQYILVVDYVSKWVKALALLTNDGWFMTQFLKKNIFSRYDTSRALLVMVRSILSIAKCQHSPTGNWKRLLKQQWTHHADDLLCWHVDIYVDWLRTYLLVLIRDMMWYGTSLHAWLYLYHAYRLTIEVFDSSLLPFFLHFLVHWGQCTVWIWR